MDCPECGTPLLNRTKPPTAPWPYCCNKRRPHRHTLQKYACICGYTLKETTAWIRPTK